MGVDGERVNGVRAVICGHFRALSILENKEARVICKCKCIFEGGFTSIYGR